MSIESVMPFSHLILCHPLLLLPSIFNSIRVFSNESALHVRWPKYWSFSFNTSPSNEHPGLISFRMDWLDLLAVQGTLKGLLQCHSSKALILQCSAFFTVQLSHPYMTTGIVLRISHQSIEYSHNYNNLIIWVYSYRWENWNIDDLIKLSIVTSYSVIELRSEPRMMDSKVCTLHYYII